METFAVIVAGGSGSRMDSQVPKQFLEIAGKPLLMHTMEIFCMFDPAIPIILALPEEHRPLWDRLCRQHRFALPHKVVNGGATRFHSVKNVLDTLFGEGIVFIHDGVRPLVSLSTLRRCYEGALSKGNAIPVVPVGESVRWQEGDQNHRVDREKLALIQTPQTFLLSRIKEAYNQEYQTGFTDDASVLENCGEVIHLVEGNRENIKITWTEDMLYAAAIFTQEGVVPLCRRRN